MIKFIAIFILLIISSPIIYSEPIRAIAFVNRVHVYEPTTVASVNTPAFSVTSENLVVCGIAVDSDDTITVTDTVGTTYTEDSRASIPDPGNHWHRIVYGVANGTNGSNVVNVDLAGASTASQWIVMCRQFSGTATSTPLDDADEAVGTGTSMATPSLTLSVSEGVIYAFIQSGEPGTQVAGSGFTLFICDSGGICNLWADEYKIVTASQVADATHDDAGWLILGELFKIASGGGGANVRAAINNGKGGK